MATKTVTINNTAYTKLDTTYDSAIDMQNVSYSTVKLVFSDTLPAPTATNYYLLEPLQGIERNSKTGSMYALSVDLVTADVTVGE